MLMTIPEKIKTNVQGEAPLSHLRRKRKERYRKSRVSAKNNMV
jgi:hypothetical protein